MALKRNMTRDEMVEFLDKELLKMDLENDQGKFFVDYLKNKALDFEDCVLGNLS